LRAQRRADIDLVPAGLISLPDVRQSIVGKFHGWEWNAPARVLSDMTVVSLAPGGDHKRQRVLHQEAEAILGTAATLGWLDLLFADGVGLPRWFWDTLPGKRTISLGRLAVALDAAPGREDQPVYAKTEAFTAFLEKLQIQKRGKVDKTPTIALPELAAARVPLWRRLRKNPSMRSPGHLNEVLTKPNW
jgi:hypothetical protein